MNQSVSATNPTPPRLTHAQILSRQKSQLKNERYRYFKMEFAKFLPISVAKEYADAYSKYFKSSNCVPLEKDFCAFLANFLQHLLLLLKYRSTTDDISNAMCNIYTEKLITFYESATSLIGYGSPKVNLLEKILTDQKVGFFRLPSNEVAK